MTGNASLLEPGTRAPDLGLPSTLKRPVGPRDYRGTPLILVFYPADWSPVCSDQLALYQELMPEFERLGAELLGISVDGLWCHLAFAKDRNLRFPLLADFEPKGEVSRAYGVYRAQDGTSERALFVIDPARGHPLELRLAYRREPGRRRDPSGARGDCGEGIDVMTSNTSRKPD